MTDTPIQVSGISFEEFLRRYDGKHAELVGGTAIVMSPASDRHQDLARFLTALLSHHVEARDLGVLRPAPFSMRIHRGGAVREPDLIFVARQHRDRLALAATAAATPRHPPRVALDLTPTAPCPAAPAAV